MEIKTALMNQLVEAIKRNSDYKIEQAKKAIMLDCKIAKPAQPAWLEAVWPEIMTEANKEAKKKSITENAIEMLVASKLKGTGILYNLIKQKIRVKVIFKIGHRLQMEMVLSHKNFMKQIDMVIDTAKHIKGLVDETNQPIKIKAESKWLKWYGEGQEEL